MDLNKLKTFYILAGTKSYTRCADKLCLTQSAVSHAIKKLETDLGFDLVDRENRQFRLTRKGEFLFSRCAAIFDQIDQALDGLADEQTLPLAITVGAPMELGASVLIKGMVPFLRKYPHIHMDFVLQPDLLEPLLSDDLDVIVDCVPHVHEEIATLPLLREEYAVIATARYIKEKKISKVKDLNRCNLLSFDKELSWWKNFINALTEEAGFGFESVTRISNVRGIINGAMESLGVGFVPKYTVLTELEQNHLVELFTETDVLNDQINIYLKKRNLNKPAFIQLIGQIQSLKLH